jgi:8-oxo-dGTP pyrophosphatase MutT (NUDIX family)
MTSGVIRPLVLAIVKNQDSILVMDGYDSDKDQKFFRLLGGGIEFGELAIDALLREFQEELGTGLENIKFISMIENIFTVSGRAGHEIVFVFEADLVNKDLYNQGSIKIMDTKDVHYATWQNREDFKGNKIVLYPKGVSDLI